MEGGRGFLNGRRRHLGQRRERGGERRGGEKLPLQVAHGLNHSSSFPLLFMSLVRASVGTPFSSSSSSSYCGNASFSFFFSFKSHLKRFLFPSLSPASGTHPRRLWGRGGGRGGRRAGKVLNSQGSLRRFTHFHFHGCQALE